MSRFSFNRPAHSSGHLPWIIGFTLVLLPALLLAGCGSQASGWQKLVLFTSAGVLGLAGLVLARVYSAARCPMRKAILAIYLLAFGCLWLTTADQASWLPKLAKGIVISLPLLLLGIQELFATTTAAPRRAHLLLHKLGQRTDWPANLAEVRLIPDVQLLRETLRDDPTPALMLLMHPRTEVRMAVLSALAFRPRWKRGQGLLVLQVVKYAQEAPVRAAAVTALANVTEPGLLGQLAFYLRDAVPEVRRATSEALFTDLRDRWPVIRHAVRACLSDPRFAADGALPCPGVLPAMALADLTVWAGEIASVGKRSALTLIRYYRRAVQEDPSPQLIAHLTEQMISGSVPAAVRVEMAHMVRDAAGLSPNVLGRMLDSDQPGPLRLLAAEAVLQQGEDIKATEVLREVARQPNREIAIAAAVVVQKCLRIDMGLPIGQPPPAPQSKQGAEVTRRVMQWAMTRPATDSAAAIPSPSSASKVAPSAAAGTFGLTETPIPAPTPRHKIFAKSDLPVEDESHATADAARIDTKTPWVW